MLVSRISTAYVKSKGLQAYLQWQVRPPERLYDVPGYLHSLEGRFLFWMGRKTPPCGLALEVGSFIGFCGNSSYLIRASAYHRVGGYDPDVRYVIDYELAARLCRAGEYVHTDEPLFYGRMHPANSSTVNTSKCLDTVDWFEVPEKIFLGRRFFNREWRRYQRISALLTARYLVGVPNEHLRGNHEMARAWAKVLLTHGNFVLGAPWLLVEAPRRLYRRISGKHRSRLVPLEPWMGPPVRQANVMAESHV